MKLRTVWVLVAALAASTAGAEAASVETPTFAACRDAADVLMAGRGVEFGDLDASHAIGLCELALVDAPDDPALLAYLGRALSKAGRFDDALSVIRRSAETGDPLGQVLLGISYRYGEGVPQNNEAALQWYRLSAKQGYAPGQANMGVMYENGRGVAQDFAVAAEWYALTAEQELARALNNLGFLCPASAPLGQIGRIEQERVSGSS